MSVIDRFEAAVRLRNLLQEGDLPRSDYHRLYEDPLTGAPLTNDLPSTDTQRKLIERARELLTEMGYPTENTNGVVSLRDPGLPAESRTLALNDDQHRLLVTIRTVLEDLDPHRVPPFQTLALLVKEYRFADFQLTLADGRTLTGTHYETRQGHTTHLHLRTTAGDVAVPAEGVTRLVVLRRRARVDFEGSPNPAVLEAPDAKQLRFDLCQGRPSSVVELIHAQAAIADLETRLPRSSDDEKFLSFEDIARSTGQKLEFVRNNAARICLLDPSLSPENDGLVRLPSTADRREPLSGSAALVALHNLAIFAALGTARPLLVNDDDLNALDTCRAELEAFLTLARVKFNPPDAPCAATVVQAIFDGAELTATTSTGTHKLEPRGVHWFAGHWWVLGSIDRGRLRNGQLALDGVIDARATR